MMVERLMTTAATAGGIVIPANANAPAASGRAKRL
jgi:co-chaperonin GroES (HSP10)